MRGQQIPPPRPWKMIRYFHSTESGPLGAFHLSRHKWPTLQASSCSKRVRVRVFLSGECRPRRGGRFVYQFANATTSRQREKSDDTEGHYRGTSLMRNCFLLGPCSRPYGGPRGVEVSYERGTPVARYHPEWWQLQGHVSPARSPCTHQPSRKDQID